jgi:hypothetical protein
MMRLVVRFLAFALALLCAGAAHAQTPAPATWLFTSDVHFNPLDDPRLVDRLAAAPVERWDAIFADGTKPLSPHGQDTNAALLHLALAQMRAAAPDPAVVVISGDFLVHQFQGRWNTAASDRSDAAFEAFADKTVAYLAYAFNAAFPHAQFLITLGNNDSTCGDYAAMPRSAFLAHFAQAWAPLVDRDGRAPDFVREFPIDGDYVTMLPNGTRVIAVDSNPWSPVAVDTCDPGGTARTDVITWFEGAVAASPAGARTWALLHIPPGFDAYSSLRANLPIPFYRPDLQARFRAVRAADGKPLGLIVAGHLHNDGFRIVDRTPLLLVTRTMPRPPRRRPRRSRPNTTSTNPTACAASRSHRSRNSKPRSTTIRRRARSKRRITSPVRRPARSTRAPGIPTGVRTSRWMPRRSPPARTHRSRRPQWAATGTSPGSAAWPFSRFAGTLDAGRCAGASHRYMLGINSSVSTSELSTPPMITMPRLERDPEPGSSASASGKLPKMTEKLVITIGRKRV